MCFQEAEPMPATFPYPTEVEKAMQVLYCSLRENDRRRYAAVEAAKLAHGGTDYIAGVAHGCGHQRPHTDSEFFNDWRVKPPTKWSSNS